jgi:phenylacetate-coenzyme A ligase PaaK-like adenylate-forming protein
MSDYQTMRQRHLQYLRERVPEHLERLDWSPERLRAHRTTRLRALLKTALARSPWHRGRLSHIDIDAVDENSLHELPIMTKADLMAHFNEIVTDPRITLDRINAHLAELTTDAYFLDEFHAVASGGSSGVRGVFVWGWEAWAQCHLTGLRRFMRDAMTDPTPAPGPPTLTIVAADRASHFTAALGQTFASPALQVHRFPVTLTFEKIIEGLNRAQGTFLMTYPSMLARLAVEARAGRLTISPHRIITMAEPLLPEIQQAAREVWGVPIANSWGTSEGGVMALGCYRDGGMHLSEDLVIVEPVDAYGQPVPVGTESAKVYLTNLFNPLLPLIRYEITDQVTLMDQPCACGSLHRRIADIQGRLDDVFTYPNGLVLHPHLFRSLLGREAHITEYQVRQTYDGAEVLLCANRPLDVALLTKALQTEMTRAGYPEPIVTARIVDELPRVGIGKLKRFVPLDRSPAPQ